MNNPRKQKGMTGIGWLLVILVVAIFGMVGIKLLPVYMDLYMIADSMDSLVTDVSAHNKPPRELKRILLKRLDINSIYDIKAEDIDITRSSTGYAVEIDYEPRISLAGNLYFVVVFDKTVDVPSSGGSNN